MATFAQIVGAKIRLHRIEHNLTQEKLAETIGMAATYLGQIERGEKNVKLQTIEKIALALHMSVFDLFNDEKEANLQQKKMVMGQHSLVAQTQRCQTATSVSYFTGTVGTGNRRFVEK